MTLNDIFSYLESKQDQISSWFLNNPLWDIFVTLFIFTPIVLTLFWTWLFFLGWLISATIDNKKEHIVFGMKCEKFQFKHFGMFISSSIVLGVTIDGFIIPLLK